MYVVEFQKRGFPNVHMLIWLDGDSKKNLIKNVDHFVSAEIPDPKVDKAGYEAVKSFMIHGPCGVQFPKSPCMKDSNAFVISLKSELVVKFFPLFYNTLYIMYSFF